MAVGATLKGSGWVILRGVRGFEEFHISVLAAHVDGHPQLLGLKIEGAPDADDASVALTSARLRRLPLTHLLQEAFRVRGFDLEGWAAVARETAAKPHQRPRGGGRDHKKAVAEVYRAAAATPGASPRKAVAAAFHVSQPTADRYIREARKAGEIDQYVRRSGGSS